MPVEAELMFLNLVQRILSMKNLKGARLTYICMYSVRGWRGVRNENELQRSMKH